MAKGLRRYIKASIQNGSLQGLPLHGLQPKSCHIQFFDDTLLMNTSTVQEEIKLSSILSDFSEASSNTFNLDKSQLFFFNTPMEIQHHLSQILDTPVCTLPSRYLRLPLSKSTTRNISWDSLLLSITKHLNNWTFHSINLPSKIVLLMLVLQAIPTYLFSTIDSPQSVIKKI
jgi:hypothetical protein